MVSGNSKVKSNEFLNEEGFLGSVAKGIGQGLADVVAPGSVEATKGAIANYQQNKQLKQGQKQSATDQKVLGNLLNFAKQNGGNISKQQIGQKLASLPAIYPTPQARTAAVEQFAIYLTQKGVTVADPKLTAIVNQVVAQAKKA